jgi:hypothetical protein
VKERKKKGGNWKRSRVGERRQAGRGMSWTNERGEKKPFFLKKHFFRFYEKVEGKKKD